MKVCTRTIIPCLCAVRECTRYVISCKTESVSLLLPASERRQSASRRVERSSSTYQHLCRLRDGDHLPPSKHHVIIITVTLLADNNTHHHCLKCISAFNAINSQFDSFSDTIEKS